MARLYSRRKGKSGSHRPYHAKRPAWITATKKETEDLVVTLAKDGRTPSEIGIILRDSHGIPNVQFTAEKSITQILKENDLAPKLPVDLTNLIKHAARIKEHFETNRQDMDAKRGLQLAESKIRRLAKYYKKEGILPPKWKHTDERVEMLTD